MPLLLLILIVFISPPSCSSQEHALPIPPLQAIQEQIHNQIENSSRIFILSPSPLVYTQCNTIFKCIQ